MKSVFPYSCVYGFLYLFPSLLSLGDGEMDIIDLTFSSYRRRKMIHNSPKALHTAMKICPAVPSV